MKKRIMGVLLAAICAIGLIGCGNTNNSDTSAKKEDTTKASYIVRIGMPTAGKHFQNFTAEQYKETIEKATNGDIIVEIYPSSQLGTATQMIQGVQDGSIEGVMIPSSYFCSFAPASAVTDIPFFFEDSQQIYDILNTPDNPLNVYLEKYGFKVAAWLKNTPRYILSQKKYESIADMKNQKIWCLPSRTLQKELNAYAASPQTLDPSDISVSLENETVDGVETDVLFMNSTGLGASAKYLNKIPNTPMTNLFCFGKDWFDKLPKDYQELLINTANDIVRTQEIPYVEKQYNGSLQALQDLGVEIVEPNDALITELKEKSESVTDSFINESEENSEIYHELSEMILNYTK